METETLEARWASIQATRPTTANGEPRPGSTGFGYVMWQNGTVDRVRILSQNRFGLVRYQRMTSGAMGEIDIRHIRCEDEIRDYVRVKHTDFWPKDPKKWDPTRLPRMIQKQVWEGTK